MRSFDLLPLWACVVGASALPRAVVERAPAAGGTGPYPAGYTTDSSLANYTIYAPKSPPASLKMPVIIWGNGACTYDGTSFEAFLTEIASQGIFIISAGTPHGRDNPNGRAETVDPIPSILKTPLDWIFKNAGSGKYANVVTTRVAAAGMSCGGIQAYTQADDSRVTAIAILNSGQKTAANPIPGKMSKPIFYFLGGPTDIAYENGERDYTVIPAGIPKWKGNLPVGHGGTYSQPNGGKFGVAATHWALWLLRGNATSAAYFTGTGSGTAKGDGWGTVSADLQNIKVEPL